MSFAKTHSGQSYCLKGQIIDIEVDLSRGLHSFSIVGLPDKQVEEAKDRISAAIKNSGYVSPKQKNHKVVISLAPAYVRKEGTHFDLAMALGYLLASEEISFNPSGRLFVGELSLDGSLRKVHGVLSAVLEARRVGFSEIFIPHDNLDKTALIAGVKIFGAKTLREVIDHLDEIQVAKIPIVAGDSAATRTLNEEINSKNFPTPQNNKKVFLEEIIGQHMAKRCLEISAAGGHNLLMTGPPGTGKTMLANALCGLLPQLSREQTIEVTSIHSAAGSSGELISQPPFRAPHHTSTHSSLIGGAGSGGGSGSNLRPGEITLAHRGVLFLDEFPEFDRRTIEALRQPLEEHVINITRAKVAVNFPAHFILVAAMNPCPCGNKTSKKKTCTCAAHEILRYQNKISGPILDRIDLLVEVADVEFSKIKNYNPDELSSDKNETADALKRISRARSRQHERFASEKLNSDMSREELSLHSYISREAARKLLDGAEAFNLSMRSYHKVWRVARTIADLTDSDEINESHVLEALQYRHREN